MDSDYKLFGFQLCGNGKILGCINAADRNCYILVTPTCRRNEINNDSLFPKGGNFHFLILKITPKATPRKAANST